MPNDDFFRKLEDRLRRFVEAPLQADVAPIVLRDRVAEAVEDRILSAVGPGGTADGQVDVRLRADSPERLVLLDAALVANGALADAVRHQLMRANVRPSADLAIGVEVVEEAGAAFDVAWTPAVANAPGRKSRYRLTVLDGTAEEASYDFGADAAVFVGRLRDVHDAAGRLVRRNDVAFVEGDEGPNATVSRAHAVIRMESDGRTLRIYDDDSTRGTSIFRAGGAGLIPVRRRGLPLCHGDLVYFGDACVRFEWEGEGASAG